MSWTWQDLEQIPEGNGYRYKHAGRDFRTAARCCLCGEFGIYADTRRCPDCEAHVQEAIAAALRQRGEEERGEG